MSNFIRSLLWATIVLATSVAGSASVVSYPYQPTSYTDTGNPWTTESKSGRKWTIAEKKCTYTSGGSVTGIWLFSPEMAFVSGNKYSISFTIRTEKTNDKFLYEKCHAYLLAGNTSASSKIYQYPEIISTSPNKKSVDVIFEYEPTESGSVYFAMEHIATSSESWECIFDNFKVEETILKKMPLGVSALTAEPAADNALAINLKWDNPSSYNTGEALVIKQINLALDGQPLAPLTDVAAVTPGLAVNQVIEVSESGFHTVDVTVVSDSDEESVTRTITTPYIGLFDGITPYYSFNFVDDPFLSFWEFTANGDVETWQTDDVDNNISVSLSYYKPIDASAVTPPLKLKADKAYKVTFKGETSNSSNAINLGVALTATDKEPMGLLTLNPVKPAKNNVAETFVTELFTPATDGIYTIDLHATANKTTASYYNNTLKLSEITIEEIAVLPPPVENVVAIPGADGELTVTLTWDTPSASATGVPLANLKATIVRDGVEIACVDVTPGASGTFVDNENLNAGYHSYQVVIANGNGVSEEPAAVVETGFVGAPLELPLLSDCLNEPYLWTSIEIGDLANGNRFSVSEGKASLTEKEKEFSDVLLSAPFMLGAGDICDWSIDATWSYAYSSKPFTLYLIPATAASEQEWIVLSDQLSASSKNLLSKGIFKSPEAGAYKLGVYVAPASYGSSSYTFTVNELSLAKKNIKLHTPPFESDFTTDEGRQQWLVFDESASKGSTFEFTESNTLYIFDSAYSSATSTSNRLNDWIVSPPIVFADGGEYDITFVARHTLGSNENYYAPFEIFVGGDPIVSNLAAGVKLSADRTRLNSDDFKEYTVTFIPDAANRVATIERDSEAGSGDGAMHIGFHFGNGTSCYPEIELQSVAVKSTGSTTGVETVTLEDASEAFTLVGRTVIAPAVTDFIEVYTISGSVVSAGRGVLTLPAAGPFIVRVSAESHCIIKTVIVK